MELTRYLSHSFLLQLFFFFFVFLFSFSVLFPVNICFRYPHHKSLRGEAYMMYGIGVSVWLCPLSECLQYVEAAFQYNKQVCPLAFCPIGN